MKKFNKKYTCLRCGKKFLSESHIRICGACKDDVAKNQGGITPVNGGSNALNIFFDNNNEFSGG